MCVPQQAWGTVREQQQGSRRAAETQREMAEGFLALMTDRVPRNTRLGECPRASAPGSGLLAVADQPEE